MARLAPALALLGCWVAGTESRAATASPFNYEEAKVPHYTLPDPLLRSNGKPVTRANQWNRARRGEVLRLFEDHVYGRSPRRPRGVNFEVGPSEPHAFDGLATRKEIRVFPTGDRQGRAINLLMYVPNEPVKPVPAFLTLNFQGNHSVHSDPGITLSTNWMRGRYAGVTNNRATEASRGSAASRFPIETILRRGYALVTFYYGDIEPDHPEGWKEGVRAALSKDGAETQWQPEDWGAIAAWAWGLSRALDYLERDAHIDARRVAVIGHSRQGKASLWAGATDTRFAMIIANQSGCGGAALSRRRFGETVERINTAFPHWFCGNFKGYNGREDDLPVDQHQLIALMAPRPVYIASAEEDLWADPRGEFLAAKHAEPVYALFGKSGLGVAEPPPLNTPVGECIGYHIRSGKHDLTSYDWEQYLNFADRHFKGGMRSHRASTPQFGR